MKSALYLQQLHTRSAFTLYVGPVHVKPVVPDTLSHKYPSALVPVSLTVTLESRILILSHGSTALHWKLARSDEVEFPDRPLNVIFLSRKPDELQLPFTPLNVVHWEMDNGGP